MFKSKIPLQTPVAIKIVLVTTIITFFAGWSLSRDAAGKELDLTQNKIASYHQDGELGFLIAEVHDAINKYRHGKGLSPLIYDAIIAKEAQTHSQDMANGNANFSHNGFEFRIKNIAENITYQSTAENIAYNQGYRNPGEQAVKGWIKSPGHQENMVGNYNLTGIGVAQNPQGECYFTQIFVLEK